MTMHLIGKTIRINHEFDNEPALVGERAVIESTGSDFVMARLTGDSYYIRNYTDGRVVLMQDEYELVGE